MAKVDSNVWAISARGFNDRFANKLLIQIDRRVVYTALFGGVFWDTQDVVLEDVDRIEVIRGPGTTAWGSNAVNGVINIYTKKASETQGALVVAGGGNYEQDFYTTRYGGRIGEDLHWRAYGKQFDRNHGFDPDGAYDNWRQARGGFRTDWTPTSDDTFTLQGDYYNGYSGRDQVTAFPTAPFARADRRHPRRRRQRAHALVARPRRRNRLADSRILRSHSAPRANVLRRSVDVRYRFSTPVLACGAASNRLGRNYRNVDDSSHGAFAFQLLPPETTIEWASIFAEDKVTLVDERWYFLPGARLEYNTYGDFQFEPSGRLLFLPDERRSCWTSVSRAARNPTQVETHLQSMSNLAATPPTFLRIRGNPAVTAESLIAYELGYRAQPNDWFSWDAAVFYNEYQELIGTEVGAPFFDPPYLIIPATRANNRQGNTRGFELTTTWQLLEKWRLFTSYSFLDMNIVDSLNQPATVTNGSSPRNQLYARSSWDVGRDVDFDLIGRYVDNLPGIGVRNYVTMDLRLAWRATRNTEFAVVGQNLLDGHHYEFGNTIDGMTATEVIRGVYGSVTWRR